MFERFTDRARKVMALANQEAQRFNHQYIGTEHILLGLVKEGSGVGARALKSLDMDLHKMRLEVEKLAKSGPEPTSGRLPLTPRAKKVIEYAVEEAGNHYVGTEHLLLGLMREQDGVAAQVLMNLGLKLEMVREEVLNPAAAVEGENAQTSGNVRPTQPELWLVHPEDQMCQSFAQRFAGLPNVRIFQKRLEELPPHDCFVTAGNSFGIMTAGVDAAVVQFHGRELMDRVQRRILDAYLGEQPVGTAFIIRTSNPQYPYVCHAPTMRVPGSIEGTDKVYCSTWSSLVAVHQHNRAGIPPIRTVALPAMGTGFGGVAFDEAARQMAAAYRHFLKPPKVLDWDVVVERHKLIAYDGDDRRVK